MRQGRFPDTGSPARSPSVAAPEPPEHLLLFPPAPAGPPACPRSGRTPRAGPPGSSASRRASSTPRGARCGCSRPCRRGSAAPWWRCVPPRPRRRFLSPLLGNAPSPLSRRRLRVPESAHPPDRLTCALGAPLSRAGLGGRVRHERGAGAADPDVRQGGEDQAHAEAAEGPQGGVEMGRRAAATRCSCRLVRGSGQQGWCRAAVRPRSGGLVGAGVPLRGRGSCGGRSEAPPAARSHSSTPGDLRRWQQPARALVWRQEDPGGAPEHAPEHARNKLAV